MSKLTLKGSFLACIITVIAAPAAAVTIDYSNSPGSTIRFDPTDGCGSGIVGCFDFTPSANNIEITSGTANTFSGSISGLFGVGSIVPLGAGAETADVISSIGGGLSIDDGSNILTADLTWIDIFTFGTVGGLNTQGTANLTNISYSGSNSDLVDLATANGGVGFQTATFQFISPTSLTELFETGGTKETSFSGSISAVPVPAAVWLFGSGLLGMAGIARRQRS